MRRLRCDHDDVARRLARAIAKSGRLIEPHGEAVTPQEHIRGSAEAHLNAAFLHPDLLMNLRRWYSSVGNEAVDPIGHAIGKILQIARPCEYVMLIRVHDELGGDA